MSFWDDRYSLPDFAYGTAPNDFLVANAEQIPKGRVLCLAEGEGRNALYLARLGYEVHAVDLSTVGLQKAMQLVKTQGLQIATEVADLNHYEIGKERWQGIVSIFAHLPTVVRQSLHRRVVEGLVPGGVFLLEAYTARQLAIGGTGGPGLGQEELFMSVNALETELAGLTFSLAQEIDREVNEGQFHRGIGAVVQIIGRKS